MKILALEKELKPLPEAERGGILQREARAVWRLQQESLLREIYFHQSAHTAVIILECEDLAEAEAALARLPLVREGYSEFTLSPLVPYPGFGRLFEPGD